jgi:hypothetical protein
MQKILTAAKHIVIFIVSLLLVTGFTVGIVSAIISFLPNDKITSFFGLPKREFIEYISELFAWDFIFTYLFKNKIPNIFYFIVIYLILCAISLFVPALLG